MEIDIAGAIRDADAWMRRTFPGARKYDHYPPAIDSGHNDLPGGWRVVAYVRAHHSTGFEMRLVCVNMETGERRLRTGWWAGQPIELADVKPEWAFAEEQPLPPMPQMARTYDD